ncbi:MAG: hypothetical protein ABWZ40_10045 [Caulobacterales bacterium]
MRHNDLGHFAGDATPRLSLGAKLLALPRGRLILFAAPLFIAFIAAAAGIGAPERVLGLIAAIGIALHIAGLVSCRRELSRLHATEARASAVNDNSLDEVRQWHVGHAYLLGALKLRLTDEATRKLAVEAEDAAYGALAALNKLSAGPQTPQPRK